MAVAVDKIEVKKGKLAKDEKIVESMMNVRMQKLSSWGNRILESQV